MDDIKQQIEKNLNEAKIAIEKGNYYQALSLQLTSSDLIRDNNFQLLMELLKKLEKEIKTPWYKKIFSK